MPDAVICELLRSPIGRYGRELDRRAGRYGLATLCIGGGQGLAAVLERVAA